MVPLLGAAASLLQTGLSKRLPHAREYCAAATARRGFNPRFTLSLGSPRCYLALLDAAHALASQCLDICQQATTAAVIPAVSGVSGTTTPTTTTTTATAGGQEGITGAAAVAAASFRRVMADVAAVTPALQATVAAPPPPPPAGDLWCVRACARASRRHRVWAWAFGW